VLQAKHPVVDKFDLSHLSDIFSGAAPLDAELQTAVAKRLPNVNVRQGYGMTEMRYAAPVCSHFNYYFCSISHGVVCVILHSPVSTLSPPSQVVAGSAGMLVPNAEARIVDVCTMRCALVKTHDTSSHIFAATFCSQRLGRTCQVTANRAANSLFAALTLCKGGWVQRLVERGTCPDWWVV